jgi:hypothetical protein
MKSIISYMGSKVPTQSTLNKPIIQKKISATEYVNYSNKNELIAFIDSLIIPNNVDTYCYIKCQCNAEYVYTTKDQLPSESLVCSCGRKIIEY